MLTAVSGTVLPITPGSLGITELGLIAVLASGAGHRASAPEENVNVRAGIGQTCTKGSCPRLECGGR